MNQPSLQGLPEPPPHYHVWIPAHRGRGLVMLSAKLTGTEIRRQRQRGSKRTARRWWRTRSGARRAMLTAKAERGRIIECHLGSQCPEALHVLAN